MKIQVIKKISSFILLKVALIERGTNGKIISLFRLLNIDFYQWVTDIFHCDCIFKDIRMILFYGIFFFISNLFFLTYQSIKICYRDLLECQLFNERNVVSHPVLSIIYYSFQNI